MTMNKQIGQTQNEMNPSEIPSKATRVINKLVFIAMALVAGLIALFLFWAFQPSDVLVVKNTPVPVRTIREHPTADGVVILNVDYCKKIKAIGRSRVSFISPSREIFLPIGEERQDPTCGQKEIPILIPHELPSGKYKVRFRIEYKINPVRTVFEDFDSLEFEVVETE